MGNGADDLVALVLALTIAVAFLLIIVVTLVVVFVVWRREQNRPNKLPPALAKVKELEGVLAPGERLVWEGRPTGFVRPPRTHALLYGLVLVAVIGAPTSVVAIALARSTARTWSLTWSELTIKGTGSLPNPTGSGPPATLTSSVTIPAPLVILGFVAVVIGWEELRRLEGWRSRRYGITDKRVVLLDPWQKTFDEIAREAVTSSTVEGRALVVVAGQTTVRLAGIEDPQAARSALESREKPSEPPASAA